MWIALKRAVTSANMLAVIVAAGLAMKQSEDLISREARPPAAWEHVALFLLYAGTATFPFILVLIFLERTRSEATRSLLGALLLGYTVMGGAYLYGHLTGGALAPLDWAVVGLSPVAVISCIHLFFDRGA